MQPFSHIKMELLLSVAFIGYLMYGRAVNRTEAAAIKKGFEELVASGDIRVAAELGKSEFACDLTGMYFEAGTEYFVVVDSDEMRRIMNIDTRSDKAKLFRYFVSVVGCFNLSSKLEPEYRGKVCGVSIESMNSLIPMRTAVRYNEILEQNKILYIYRSEDILIKDGDITRIPNTYSRYEDREIAMKFAINYQEHYGWTSLHDKKKSSQIKANNSRSLAQKYHNLCKGNQYDMLTVREIYEWAQNWNRAQKGIYDEERSRGYDGVLCQKDMTVFKQFSGLFSESEKQSMIIDEKAG